MRRFTFHLIPHTHWDREWYLTRAEFQARLVPVLDQVLAQLEQHPLARFVLDGQTVLLEDYLAIRPEAFPRLAAQVRRGALEIGPWYVLSDLLVPAGVSLRRNLEEGIADAARFGGHLKVLYSPDAFGHPAELPALAAEFGLRWAVVRRGLGRPAGQDRDFYRWESGSGKSVLTYHLPAGGYDGGMALAEPGVALAPAWRALRKELVARAVGAHVAVWLGADHHAMVADVVGLGARLQALEPDHEVRVSGLGEFFQAVEQSPLPQLTELHGELRRSDGHTWVLQGVHGSRARLKRAHGAAELVLARIAQPLVGLASAPRDSAQPALLRAAWRLLLQSQFHDTLAGTTSDAVQREQEVRLHAVSGLARELVRGALEQWVGHDPDRSRGAVARVTPRLLLWNPLPRARAGILTAALTFFRRDVLVGPPARSRKPRQASAPGAFALETATGEVLPVQLLAIRPGQERRDAARHYPDQDEVERVWIAFSAPRLPGLGRLGLSLRPGAAPLAAGGATARRDLLANRFVTLRIAPTGALELTDQRSGERYAGLLELRDEPDRGDLYTWSPGPARRAGRPRPLSRRVLAAGPLLAALETRWSIPSASPEGGRVTVRQVVTLHADSPLTRIRFDLENAARDHRLRARLPLQLAGPALAGTPFGSLVRAVPASRRSPPRAERPPASAPAQRYVAVAQAGRGLALLSPGFFEYEWTATGDLWLSLLRSVGELSRAGLPERPGHAAWPLATPEAQEPGAHRIELALAPLRAEDLRVPARLERLWEAAFLPVQSFWFRDFSGA